MQELIVPDAARADAESFEVLRVWVAQGNQHFSSKPTAWEDPAGWGVLLADLVRHIAAGYAHEKKADVASVTERILAGFEAEWGHPTE